MIITHIYKEIFLKKTPCGYTNLQNSGPTVKGFFFKELSIKNEKPNEMTILL